MENKRILVLTGSPRDNGNSELMANAFIKGAEAAGHTVFKYEAGKKEILGCRACKICAIQKGRCVYNDEFKTLIPLVKNAQVLVFSSPLYSFALSAQLKAVLDRFYCFEFMEGMNHIKESALLICGGETNEMYYQGAILSYRLFANYQGWINRGIIMAKGVRQKGDICNREELELCTVLGKKM